jgi:flagellar biosynthesis regulator FlaF
MRNDTTATPIGSGDSLRDAIHDAKVLADAAVLLQEARGDEAMARALKHDLELWFAIRHDLTRSEALPAELRTGLIQLAEYVTTTILRAEHAALTDAQVQALITINLRVSAGLLEGQVRRLFGDELYDLWQRQGRPEGQALESWLSGAAVPAGA